MMIRIQFLPVEIKIVICSGMIKNPTGRDQNSDFSSETFPF